MNMQLVSRANFLRLSLKENQPKKTNDKYLKAAMLLNLIMAYKLSIVCKKLSVALIYITRFFVVGAKKLWASSLCHSLVPHTNVELLLRYRSGCGGKNNISPFLKRFIIA